jgi:hypothetical protein
MRHHFNKYTEMYEHRWMFKGWRQQKRKNKRKHQGASNF